MSHACVNMIRSRAVLLLVCVCLGALTGAVGMQFTKSEAWFLAVPCVMALGWLFVADPTACQSSAQGVPPAESKDRAA
jgi:hypothetical protein